MSDDFTETSLGGAYISTILLLLGLRGVWFVSGMADTDLSVHTAKDGNTNSYSFFEY